MRAGIIFGVLIITLIVGFMMGVALGEKLPVVPKGSIGFGHEKAFYLPGDEISSDVYSVEPLMGEALLIKEPRGYMSVKYNLSLDEAKKIGPYISRRIEDSYRVNETADDVYVRGCLDEVNQAHISYFSGGYNGITTSMGSCRYPPYIGPDGMLYSTPR